MSSSTTLGTFSQAHVYQPSHTPAYSVTKAALNMLSLQYSYKYKDEGLTFLTITPGVSYFIFPLAMLSLAHEC